MKNILKEKYKLKTSDIQEVLIGLRCEWKLKQGLPLSKKHLIKGGTIFAATLIWKWGISICRMYCYMNEIMDYKKKER